MSSSKTPTRTFRCPDALWEAAKEKAASMDITVTDVLIESLEDFVGI